MKNIRYFKTLSEYKKFFETEIVVNKEFHAHPFYKGLLNFIVDHRTPIFFDSSKAFEYAHFTQYFNWCLMRNYNNKYVRDLYYLHDLVHMLFENPMNPKIYTKKAFQDIVRANERVASNETEILVYFRLPEIRNKTLDFPILYDFIKDQQPPKLKELFTLRNSIIEKGFIPDYLKNQDGKIVLAYYSRFNTKSHLWTDMWHDNFHADIDAYLNMPLVLPLFEYDKILTNYVPINSENKYRENTIRNVNYALSASNLPQIDNWTEVKKALSKLENKIILEQEANSYFKSYSKRKTASLS